MTDDEWAYFESFLTHRSGRPRAIIVACSTRSSGSCEPACPGATCRKCTLPRPLEAYSGHTFGQTSELISRSPDANPLCWFRSIPTFSELPQVDFSAFQTSGRSIFHRLSCSRYRRWQDKPRHQLLTVLRLPG